MEIAGNVVKIPQTDKIYLESLHERLATKSCVITNLLYLINKIFD